MSESKADTTPDATEYKGKVNLVSSEGDKFEVETKTAAMSELVKSTFLYIFFLFFFSIRSQILFPLIAQLKKKKSFCSGCSPSSKNKSSSHPLSKIQHTPMRCVRVALRLEQSFPFFFLISFLLRKSR